MGAVCGCNRGTAISSEHNSSPQLSSPMSVSNESAPTVGCEVPAVTHKQMPPLELVDESVPTVGCEVPAAAHEQMPPLEVAEDSSSCDNNKRVQEARRARVEWLKRLRRNCGNEEEFQTARTKPIWTKVDSSSSCSSSSCTPQGPSPAALQRVREENRRHFQHLMNNEERMNPRGRYGGRTRSVKMSDPVLCDFYVDFGDQLKVGRKIGGGGQADIHEAIHNGRVFHRFVLKVFSRECLLSDLQRTWSKDIGHAFRGALTVDILDHGWGRRGVESGRYCCIHHGTLLQDGRFAFVLERCWGDLRKYIDLHMVKDKTHQSPPLPNFRALQIMEDIASGMVVLHCQGIIHKDLKAANCLLEEDEHILIPSGCLVADFESSVGGVGTGFWRPPEILLALNNREGDNNSIQEVWTKMGDVYSYAMTCYEVLTGCIPFEDRATNDYDGVIGGERPPLPDYVHPKLQELVRRCWHPKPSMRPSFDEIQEYFHKMTRPRI